MQSSEIGEYVSLATRVYGGCCTNVFSLETLMSQNAALGSALTFCQLVFIAAQHLPSFLQLKADSFPPTIRLKPRHVPLYMWIYCVVLLTGVSLANNWAFAYRVPVSLQILIRSAGLGVAMCVGRLFLNKRYTLLQVFAVIITTFGVILATYSRPSVKRAATSAASSQQERDDASMYLIGVALLIFSLVLSGVLGALQETIFKKYGPHWQESIFYTHILSIPFFIFLLPEVRTGFQTSFTPIYTKEHGIHESSIRALGILLVNLLSQSYCVGGVNRLTTRMSSVSANLVLTGRKAASLCLSVYWFNKDGWNRGMTVGAVLVFCGTLLYGAAGRQERTPVVRVVNDRSSKPTRAKIE